MIRVAFIDDDKLEQRIFQLMSKNFSDSQTVTYSNDAEDFIHFLKLHQNDPAHLPDKILIDLHMPQYDGYTFLKDYEDLDMELRKKIDVYIVSSSIAPKDLQLANDYSFIKAYLIKPLTIEHLKEIFNAA